MHLNHKTEIRKGQMKYNHLDYHKFKSQNLVKSKFVLSFLNFFNLGGIRWEGLSSKWTCKNVPSFVSISCSSSVVYFYQHLDAAHSKPCLKSSFLRVKFFFWEKNLQQALWCKLKTPIFLQNFVTCKILLNCPKVN